MDRLEYDEAMKDFDASQDSMLRAFEVHKADPSLENRLKAMDAIGQYLMADSVLTGVLFGDLLHRLVVIERRLGIPGPDNPPRVSSGGFWRGRRK